MDRALSPHPIELSRSPNAVTSGLNGWLSCKDQETPIERLSPDAVDVRAAQLWPTPCTRTDAWHFDLEPDLALRNMSTRG